MESERWLLVNLFNHVTPPEMEPKTQLVDNGTEKRQKHSLASAFCWVFSAFLTFSSTMLFGMNEDYRMLGFLVVSLIFFAVLLRMVQVIRTV